MVWDSMAGGVIPCHGLPDFRDGESASGGISAAGSIPSISAYHHGAAALCGTFRGGSRNARFPIPCGACGGRTIFCTSRHRQPMPNAIPERIPFPAWKRFTRRCSSGVLPCCWRRRGSPVKLRCWNGWRHWHGRAAGGICLVLFMLWESRAH